MTKIILDKNSTNEMIIPVDVVYERILYNILSGSMQFKLNEGEIEIPSIKSRHFDSIEVVTESGESVPIVLSYNAIESFMTEYDDKSDIFTYSIEITNK